MGFYEGTVSKQWQCTAMKQCEIIYVLDSPEQEEELKTFSLTTALSIKLPVKLGHYGT